MSHREKRALPLLAFMGLTLHGLYVHAHELITAEYADRCLAVVTQYSTTLRSSGSAEKRAEAAFQLAKILDQTREFLNRDITSHGRVQGLLSTTLVNELKARGTPLVQNARGYFLANAHYYREALKLAPGSPREGDILFNLLQGHFYDSFYHDPLSPNNQSWAQLEQQIEFGERFMRLVPKHAEMEEARFILLTHYVQAARSSSDGGKAKVYADKALAAIADFEQRYPDSMRAAALPVMRSGLERK